MVPKDYFGAALGKKLSVKIKTTSTDVVSHETWLQPSPPLQSIHERQGEAVLLNVDFSCTREAAPPEEPESDLFSKGLKKALYVPFL